MKICEPLEIVKKLAPFKVLIFIMIFTSVYNQILDVIHIVN